MAKLIFYFFLFFFLSLLDTKAKRSFAPLAIQHNHNEKHKKKKMKNFETKLVGSKFSYVSMKDTGGTCLIFSEFVILMRDKMHTVKS